MKDNIIIAVLVAVLLSELAVFPLLLQSPNPKVDAGKSTMQNTILNITPTQEPQLEAASLMLLGDIMLGRSVMIATEESGDANYPFVNVADKLKQVNIVFANLENPIVKDCPRYETGFIFCASPSLVQGLVYAGVDVVNIANNHTRNFGEKGFEETKMFLTQNGVKYVGDNNLETIQVGKTNFGFLGFDYVSNSPSPKDLELISESDKKVDILVIGVHWGTEYKAKANDFQRKWAKEFVNNGADVIAGHHPHWVQDSEDINGKLVFYSLGNFIFDQMWSEETKKGVALELNFSGKLLTSIQEYKTYIPIRGQPIFVEE